MTLTFTSVKRQYGQVIVGTETDLAMALSFKCCDLGLLGGQPRSVTVVLGWRAAVEGFTNRPVMALRW